MQAACSGKWIHHQNKKDLNLGSKEDIQSKLIVSHPCTQSCQQRKSSLYGKDISETGVFIWNLLIFWVQGISNVYSMLLCNVQFRGLDNLVRYKGL